MYYEQDYLVVQRSTLARNVLSWCKTGQWKDDIWTEFQLLKITMQILMKEWINDPLIALCSIILAMIQFKYAIRFFLLLSRRLSLFLLLPPSGKGRVWTRYSEAGMSKNNCAANSGSPEVELRCGPSLILFKYWTGWPDLSSFCVPIMWRGLRSASGDRTWLHVRVTWGSHRDVVYLGRPIAPSYMSPNAGAVGWLRGLSQWVQLCT